MTTAADVFDPQLLRTLRAAPWRTIERRFLFILAASIGLHLAFASYLAAQPTVVTPELSIDELDRFLPTQQTLPPLHKIPKIANIVNVFTDGRRPTVRPLVHPRTLDAAKIAKTGLLVVLGSKGPEGAFTDLLNAPGTEIFEALKDARGLQLATADSIAHKGSKTGDAVTVERLGTAGVKNVGLGTRVDSRPTAPPDGPIIVEKTTIDPRILQQFIAARRAAIQNCYERALLHNPGLQGGKVVLRLAVGVGGRVNDLDIEEDTLGSEAVTSCMSTLVKRWVFPVAPKEELPVSVPFIFARSN